MSRDFANNNLMDEILAAFAVQHKCPINYSCRKRRFGEDLPYATICDLCGGYQRYETRRLPVVYEEDDSHELLRFGELTINPTNSPISPNSPDCERIVEEVVPEREEMAMEKLTFSQMKLMRGYAEMLQWRIEDGDEEKVDEFCVEIGVTSEVFKTWLRNNGTKLVDGVVNVESFNGGGAGGGECSSSGDGECSSSGSGINGSG